MADDTTEVVSPFSDASIFDLLKQEAQELADNKEVDIPVKGYEGTNLMIRYHLPESAKELDDIARRVSKDQKDPFYRNLYTVIDTMIWLCSGLFVQPEGVPEPVMLDPEQTGHPVHFDVRLAGLIGMLESANGSEPTARNVVRKLFGGNDLAIISHAEKLNRWLQNTKADLSLEIWQVGEV